MGMAADADVDRIEVLADRVRWLDRYRRLIAIFCAAVSAPIVMYKLTAFLGSDWPGFHVTALTVLVATITWWVVEVWLAWMTAVYETECDRLMRDRSLPRAELVRRR